MKELQKLLICYIDNPVDYDLDFANLVNFIKNEKVNENLEEQKEFFHILLKIANNHSRQHNFRSKIENLLLYYSEEIKQHFSATEIFDIFKNNQLLIHLLIANKIITVDKSIANLIIEKSEIKRSSSYLIFFYPEIEHFIEKEFLEIIKEDINKIDSDIFNNFEVKRQKGENDSYLSLLIRNDSVEEFVAYVNRANLPLKTTTIKPSIFETNSFLQNKTPTLIEYATFFASIQIFQFLRYNNVELKSSLWLYAIHSNNPEFIHILEENKVKPPEKSYKICVFEGIKCHHNEIVDYIIDTFLYDDAFDVSEISIRYHNYAYFPNDLFQRDTFYYLYQNKYLTLVDLFIEKKKNEIEQEIISIHFNLIMKFIIFV